MGERQQQSKFLYLERLESNPTLSQDDFCVQYGSGFAQSTFCKWVLDKEKIFELAAKEKTANLFRTPTDTPVIKHEEMEKQLLEQFQERRKFGRRVTAQWLKLKAKTIAKELKPESTFKASNGWFYLFIKRNRLSLKSKTNSKKFSAH